MDEELRAHAERAIRERVFPGCVIGVVRQNGARAVLPLGRLKYDANVSEVVEHTLYDLASITKSIPVASLALILVSENPPRLNLGGKVIDYLPELKNDYGATIEDLLRYRVTGPRMSTLAFRTFEEIRTHIFEHGFENPPGEGTYTNLPAFLLGIILERASGETLPALSQRYFFEPLDMINTTFFPCFAEASQGKPEIIAPTEIIDGEEIRGIVHDESARRFARRRRAVGHAGLFSTAPDLLQFLGAILAGKLQAVVAGAQKGLGWETNREWMGKYRSRKTFGKTGFTGTSILCDIEKGIGLVILSNRTYPHRPPDNSAINLFRKEIAEIVFA